MKAKKAADAKRLEDIPNVGMSTVKDLRGIGIDTPMQLKGNDGIELYHKLNKITGIRHDPCVADTFLAAVDFMNGGKAKPWWKFTNDRRRLCRN